MPSLAGFGPGTHCPSLLFGLGVGNGPRRQQRLPERQRVPQYVPKRSDTVWSADVMSEAHRSVPKVLNLLVGPPGLEPGTNGL